LQTHTIPIPFHGRYLVEAPDSAPPPPSASAPVRPLLVGFHGYKENAEAQMEVLRAIAGARGWVLVSVQAPNRFYSQGEKVAASWMTRQDRELAIEDNIAYVRAVVAEVSREYGAGRPLVYAGFSQGVAMAYRAAARAGHACGGLVLLAGDVPPDVAADVARMPPVLLGRGTGDAWYTAERSARDLDVLRAAGVPVEAHVFDGGHEWEPSFIARAGRFLDDRLQA